MLSGRPVGLHRRDLAVVVERHDRDDLDAHLVAAEVDGERPEERRLVAERRAASDNSVSLSALPGRSSRSRGSPARPMCTSPPTGILDGGVRRRTESAMSSALPLRGEFEVAVDGLRRCASGSTCAARYTGSAQRGGEIPGGGDRQVAHPAAAHVGGVGAVDPVAVDQQLRGVHRAADDDRAARAPAARAAASSAESAASQATAIWIGPRTAASATASQCPPERGSRARMRRRAGQRGVGRRRRSARRGRREPGGRPLQRLGDRRGARRGRAVERVGGPHHQLLGVVGGVEPAAGTVGVGEVRRARCRAAPVAASSHVASPVS